MRLGGQRLLRPLASQTLGSHVRRDGGEQASYVRGPHFRNGAAPSHVRIGTFVPAEGWFLSRRCVAVLQGGGNAEARVRRRLDCYPGLAVRESAGNSPMNATEAAEVQCPHCGGAIKSGATICKHCREAITGAPSAPQAQKSTASSAHPAPAPGTGGKRSPLEGRLGWVIVGVLVVAIGGYAAKHRSGGQPGQPPADQEDVRAGSRMWAKKPDFHRACIATGHTETTWRTTCKAVPAYFSEFAEETGLDSLTLGNIGTCAELDLRSAARGPPALRTTMGWSKAAAVIRNCASVAAGRKVDLSDRVVEAVGVYAGDAVRSADRDYAAVFSPAPGDAINREGQP